MGNSFPIPTSCFRLPQDSLRRALAAPPARPEEAAVEHLTCEGYSVGVSCSSPIMCDIRSYFSGFQPVSPKEAARGTVRSYLSTVLVLVRSTFPLRSRAIGMSTALWREM